MNTISHTAKKGNAPGSSKGFTLLELLIVIAVIAVLSAILIFILDPTETLSKSRDAQRISDLGSLKTAIGIYLTTTPGAQLDGIAGTKQDKCLGGAGAKTVFLSIPAGAPAVTSPFPSGFTTFGQVTAASSTAIDGTGWVPVNLGAITGGSPISSLPIDPTNTVSAAGALADTDLLYRYACKKSPLTFELDAKLESIAFTTTDNRASKDGGNNATLLEVGTDATILP
jgi:prepilin-type N-terminal cleavage/methylation domain-containing protein